MALAIGSPPRSSAPATRRHLPTAGGRGRTTATTIVNPSTDRRAPHGDSLHRRQCNAEPTPRPWPAADRTITTGQALEHSWHGLAAKFLGLVPRLRDAVRNPALAVGAGDGRGPRRRVVAPLSPPAKFLDSLVVDRAGTWLRWAYISASVSLTGLAHLFRAASQTHRSSPRHRLSTVLHVRFLMPKCMIRSPRHPRTWIAQRDTRSELLDRLAADLPVFVSASDRAWW